MIVWLTLTTPYIMQMISLVAGLNAVMKLEELSSFNASIIIYMHRALPLVNCFFLMGAFIVVFSLRLKRWIAVPPNNKDPTSIVINCIFTKYNGRMKAQTKCEWIFSTLIESFLKFWLFKRNKGTNSFTNWAPTNRTSSHLIGTRSTR